MVLSLYLMHKLKEEFLFLLGLNLIIQPLVLHISNVTRSSSLVLFILTQL